MWAGFALAFLAKGPPGLLPLLAVVAFELAQPARARARVLRWQGLLRLRADRVAVVRGR